MVVVLGSQNSSNSQRLAEIAQSTGRAAYLIDRVSELRDDWFRPTDTVLVTAGASAPETPQELALARKLVKFSDAVQLATNTLRPHFLSLYLYELASEFSTFYAADKVIVEDAAVHARRLLLCHRTLTVLETGLHLLGLRTDLERM